MKLIKALILTGTEAFSQRPQVRVEILKFKILGGKFEIII